MSGLKALLLISAVACVVRVPPAVAQTVSGVWQQIDPRTGKVGALVTFSERGGLFSGHISKLFPDPGEDPRPLCHKCPGAQRDKPILGLVFIEGMRRSGWPMKEEQSCRNGHALQSQHATQS
jgi:Uncharacterized protein conserved in bacteria (DUF2147)